LSFDSTVASCIFDDQNTTLTGVTVESRASDQVYSTLPCANLILAVGPYTTHLLGDLFTNNTVGLEKNVFSAHWCTVISSTAPNTADVGLLLPEAAASERRLQAGIAMLGRPADNTIKLTAYSAHKRTDHLTSEDALRTRPGKTTELRGLLAPVLNTEMTDITEKKNMRAAGRSELCTANGEAPIIDRVPPSMLGVATTGEKDGSLEGGVWLCYGFRQYGTSLAPGAARMLASRIIGGAAGGQEYCINPTKKGEPTGNVESGVELVAEGKVVGKAGNEQDEAKDEGEVKVA
jgi:glycine/D-amino acid oxidase-like deaminating enzyme